MTTITVHTIGLDLGDRSSYYVMRDKEGRILGRGRVGTSKGVLERRFGRINRCRVVMEAGGQSGWVSRLFKEMDFEVVVANPRKIPWLTQSHKKTDRTDAEMLSEIGQIRVSLLEPIEHRDEEKQKDLSIITAREQLIKVRTNLINHVRGVLKSMGIRVRKCSTACFAKVARGRVPETMQEALGPVLETVASLSGKIKAMDKTVLKLCRDKYPETRLLMEVRGVGALTALAFALIVDNPERFETNRSVGAYLGLVRKMKDSGKSSPELGISKAGHKLMRRLLVNCAQYILGHFGEDSDLRRHGKKLAAKGGKVARKKAVVAVARKLSVVLLHLWRNGEIYQPLYNAEAA